ncbi:MAG TPA: hypothetical protein VMV94_13530 [Phycisphaerae bacterium]|nr:hypothetical protein [Phycisphaerae bacterium]
MTNNPRRAVCSCTLPQAVLLTVAAVLSVAAPPVVAANRVVLCEEFTNLW